MYVITICTDEIIIPHLHINFYSKNIKNINFYNFMHFVIWLLALTMRVIENRVLRKICRPKKDEVTEWKRLHNEQLSDLYCSSNVIWMVISRIMG